MTKTKKLELGDYVLATKYSDGDPQDQWCVGFYAGVLEKTTEERFLVVDEKGVSFRGNGFRRIKKISHDRGCWIIKNMEEISIGRRSVWWWARKKMDP